MKYYEVMETECSTPIQRRGVGADFFHVTEDELDEVLEAIANRGNNSSTDEITKEQYEYEQERNQRRAFNMVAGLGPR